MNMRRQVSTIGIAVALIVFVAGCAGPTTTELGSALPRADGAAAAKESGLEGTWRGSFGQVMTGDSGQIHGDIVSEINADGTYRTTWTTRLVAGSARGGRLEMTGKVVADGPRVMFTDARSGGRMTLRRDGDTLYGITIDPATKRVTVAVELHRVGPAPEAP
jgi:hypothetical protein